MPHNVKEGEQRRVAYRCRTVLGRCEDLRQIRQEFIAESDPLLGGAVERINASTGRESNRYVCRKAEEFAQNSRPHAQRSLHVLPDSCYRRVVWGSSTTWKTPSQSARHTYDEQPAKAQQVQAPEGQTRPCAHAASLARRALPLAAREDLLDVELVLANIARHPWRYQIIQG